ncbi:MAG: dihydrofolate reductase [bacterium]
MNRPIISIVVAVDSAGGIGKNNKLLWHIPEDVKRFKSLTMGHPVIMGRKTFESVLSYLKKPLPGRTNIVVTRNPDFKSEGVIVCKSIDEAIKLASNIESVSAKASTRQSEIIIGGGAQIYNSIIDRVDRLYLTVVEGDFKADAFFQHTDKFKKIISKEEKQYQGIKFTFLTLEKRF